MPSVDEIRRMKADGPTAEELAKAKGYYAGSYPFSLQTRGGHRRPHRRRRAARPRHGYVQELPLRMAAVDAAAGQGGGRASCCSPTSCWS